MNNGTRIHTLPWRMSYMSRSSAHHFAVVEMTETKLESDGEGDPVSPDPAGFRTARNRPASLQLSHIQRQQKEERRCR